MKIDIELPEEMADMFLRGNQEMEVYYCMEDQEFYYILDEDVNDYYDPELAEEIRSDHEKYLQLPRINDNIRYDFMSDFVDRLPAGRAKKMMLDALDDVSSFERFDEYMSGLGLEDAWNDYFSEKCVQYINEWYENREDEEDSDDDEEYDEEDE